ncbi:hypothetical protein [Lysobacter capsici]|uniref:hypothetical protein n=1 Tax=Lysobacter capsici TaxID=435897 RepID=UPI0012905FB6|nr:hypothetical protein [Lysobacter capsici]
MKRDENGLDVPTGEDELAAVDDEGEETRRIYMRKVYHLILAAAGTLWGALTLLALVMSFILLCFYGYRGAAAWLSCSLSLIGAAQICAGVYIKPKGVRALKEIVKQGRKQKRKVLREVDVNRAIYAFLNELADTKFDLDAIDDLKANYEKKIYETSSGKARLPVLSQADLARTLLVSSQNAKWGTVLVAAAVVTEFLSTYVPGLMTMLASFQI